MDNEINYSLTPQEIQKKFPEYDELVEDLMNVNKCLINYIEILHEIVFGKKWKIIILLNILYNANKNP